MKIVTRSIEEPTFDDNEMFEGCSEAPCGCDRCCDRAAEASGAGEPVRAVASLEDLFLTH
jgi:hypothetical protein